MIVNKVSCTRIFFLVIYSLQKEGERARIACFIFVNKQFVDKQSNIIR